MGHLCAQAFTKRFGTELRRCVRLATGVVDGCRDEIRRLGLLGLGNAQLLLEGHAAGHMGNAINVGAIGCTSAGGPERGATIGLAVIARVGLAGNGSGTCHCCECQGQGR